MFWKNFIRDYLTFSRRERVGILSLLFLVGLLYLTPVVLSRTRPVPVVQDSLLQAALDNLEKRGDARKVKEHYSRYPPFDQQSGPVEFTEGSLFAFDPNTLDERGWKRLGLPERTARTIIKYRNKGGKFYRPEDLQKIWGLPEGFYERVQAYIELPGSERHEQRPFEQKTFKSQGPRTFTPVSINSADTTEWIALPGIGSKLAARIVLFREKLGGFASIEQVKEIYGLQDSTFQKIRPLLVQDGPPFKKIKINSATVEELKDHPYLKWTLSKAIVAYRSGHGPFASIDDLKKVALVDDAILEKLRPYLSLE
jgi:competence ComEA-like helix-hairpin-helix protein